jgi:hypothetical protein
MWLRAALLLTACCMGIGFVGAAFGQQDQWEFWASNDPLSEKFDNEGEAADRMRAGSHPKDQYLTGPGPIVHFTDDTFQRMWTVPPVDVVLSEWEYWSFVEPGGPYETYGEAKSAAWAQITSVTCGPLFELLNEGEWVDTVVAWGQVTGQEKRVYYKGLSEILCARRVSRS